MAPTKFVKYGRANYKTKEHPLYKTWRNIRYTYDYEKIWDEFSVFCLAVGQRPFKTDLKRLDASLPFGPDNWHWKKRVGC